MCQIGRIAALRILILGGYGTFGGRLARLPADEERITLIVAGRSMARAEAFCAVLSARHADASVVRGAFVSQHARARTWPFRVAVVRAVRAGQCRHGIGAG